MGQPASRDPGVFVLRYTTPPRYTGDNEAWAKEIERYLGEQYRTIQRVLSGGLRWQNLRSELILAIAVTATQITQAHTLGKTPEFLFLTGDTTALDLHVTSTDKAAWTDTSFQFTSAGTGNVDAWVI